MRSSIFLLLFIAIPVKLLAFGTNLIDNDSSFHVTYVRITLSVSPDTEYVAGNVTLRCVARTISQDNRIQLSLKDSQRVDSVKESGVSATFDHVGDSLFVTLGQHYAPGKVFDITVFYHGSSRTGNPVRSIEMWDSLGKVLHPELQSPICWTVSEPYYARMWWPCKDNPADKIDSADLYITCAKPNMIGSNGSLMAVIDNDTTRTYWWHEAYPIDHYLVAFVCGAFDTFSHWHYWLDGDSTRIMNFVFAASADTMSARYVEVDSILDLYEKWFGPYAFRKEKYGIAEWHGGGMENQTLSFCNNSDSGLIAHETAHQWFGDAITCKTWNECWLNEGFAVYTTDLFFRNYEGDNVFNSLITSSELGVTYRRVGTLYTPDSLLQTQALGGLVYDKGALVLHMLNFVLGSDTAYFRALREYVTGPLRYGVASSDDLRDAVEKASGRDLHWFFNEWVYGDGFPIYSVNWSAYDGLHPAVAISQTGSSPFSPFFIMPIELEFTGAGIDTTVQVWDDESLKAFQFTFSKPVSKMIFDPHNWLLDGEQPRTLNVGPAGAANESSLQVIKNLDSYDINFITANTGLMTIQFYDQLGRPVASIDAGVEDEGQHSISWHPIGLSDGAYFCRLLSDGSPIAFAHFVLTKVE